MKKHLAIFLFFFAIMTTNQHSAALSQENEQMNGPPRTFGLIAKFEGFSGKHLRLIDGRYVDLHDYTVIEPEGAELKKGQRILIRGFFAPGTREGHVTIDARAITIINGDGKDH